MRAEDSERLQKIDKLYAIRIDQLVPLPMIVVVGDQSSGKSSILEALVTLPFAKDSGLCTRFPTQVVFKRAAESKIEIMILPSKTSTEDSEEGHLWTRTVETLDERAFCQILSEACQRMGVPGPGEPMSDNLKGFSHDLLKIELTGPNHEHFSVVDLPGIFRKPIPGQTTKEDMVFVKDLIRTYMKNERSIILAVASANIDIATQEIVQMAEDIDPESRRTLGVMTKPDIVDKGAEGKVIDLLLRRNEASGLGYIVLCNRSQSQMHTSLQERNDAEIRFFSQAPWDRIPKDRAGITALRACLDKLLADLTRNNFCDVAEDVRRREKELEDSLRSLGPERLTAAEQRTHLIKIATSFQYLTSHALDAYYGRDACFRSHRELRLATIVKGLQEKFSENMRLRGHTRGFKLLGEPVNDLEGLSHDSDDDFNILTEEEDVNDLEEHQSREGSKYVPLATAHEKILRRVLKYPNLPPNSEERMSVWIRKEYNASKGFEIGTINPSLLPILYHEQIRKWRYYATSHLNSVIGATHAFVFALLNHLCDDPATRDRFWAHLSEKLLESYQRAVDHTELLLRIEETGNMRTMNHYFAVTLQKLRRNRLQKKFLGAKAWSTNDSKAEPLIQLQDVLNIQISNEDQAVDDLHDILQSYYKVARKQFVDAVTKGAVDYLLLTFENGPLKVCTPEFVGALSDKELAEIAGESPEQTTRRREITHQLKLLRQAYEILEA